MLSWIATLAIASTPPPPIVNGTEVAAGDWQSVALVWNGRDEWCTGVLVAPRVVLTAGHCIRGATHVSFGTDAQEGHRYAVDSKEAHPKWARTYDVGVLVLDSAPGLDVVTVSTAQLEDGVPGIIVGWGLTDERAREETDFLQEATVAIWDHDCSERGWDCNPAVQPGGELVAGGASDTCTGDSGGPIFQNTRQGTVLIGIVSRGVHPSKHMCGDGGIYVRSDAIASWVETTAGVTLDWDGYREPDSAEWSGPKNAGQPYPYRGCSVGAGSPTGPAGPALLGLLLWGLSVRSRKTATGPTN
jgi:secreted trypsin-like serine protease